MVVTASIPRLRVFAGPNGSGKSTLKDALNPQWLGVYVNAGDLEAHIRAHGWVSLAPFGVVASESAWRSFCAGSRLLQDRGLSEAAKRILLDGDRMIFDGVAVNSYVASVLADFIRSDLLRRGVSFSFATVMSAPQKVAFLCQAQRRDYRTYPYFIATADPEINVARVAHRVSMGKHDVPRHKIIERYHRSLALLADAVQCSDPKSGR